MRRKIELRRVAAFLLCFVLCGACLPGRGLAAALDEVEKCSLELSYVVDEDRAMEGVEFRLYRVAEITDAMTFRLLEEYRKYQVTASDWLARAMTLSGYVARDQILPTTAGLTDGEGRVSFSQLEKGLYLIVGDARSLDGYVYTPTPFLLSLPYTADGRSWEADVVTYAKYGRRSTGGGGSTDPETVSYRVLKVWEDRGHEEERPERVTVELLRDGQVYDSVELNQGNNWRHDWTGLDAGGNWQVAERETKGYSVSVSQGGITFVITNSYLERGPETPPAENREELPPEEEDITDWKPPLSGWEEELPPSEEEELEDEEPPLARLPQTGQLWWPVPLLAMGGAALLLLGIARRRRWSGEDEE